MRVKEEREVKMPRVAVKGSGTFWRATCAVRVVAMAAIALP